MNTATETEAQVSTMLRELIACHEQMLEAVREHRRALAKADREAIDASLRRQAELVERIRVLDEQRRRNLGHNVTVQEVAARLGEKARRRLLDLGAHLRGLIEQVRDEQAVVAVASRSLLAHMEGLLSQVVSRLNHAGTYGRLGRVEAGVQIVTGIDLTR
ncbi:MAG: hypothetical protein Kow0022_04440 [Phycisphaerales bacterium]